MLNRRRANAWHWFERSRFIGDQFLVDNGFDEACDVRRGTYYTYNQGVILSALTELAKELKQPELLTVAKRVANATMDKMVYPDGILKEASEPVMSGDNTQFKGIFMRHLARLHSVAGDRRSREFLLRNGDAVWNRARNPDNNRIGAIWVGPFDAADAARQSAALDALNAAMTATAGDVR